jgi:hypothetical protein
MAGHQGFLDSFVVVKRCSKCGTTKPLAAFHRHRDRGHQAWCKACRKLYDSAYHRRTRTLRLEQKRRWQAAFRGWYISLKEGKPCADCGSVLPPAVMQWDHLPGTDKTAELGRLWRTYCKQRVLDEIAKCELVCANCHALRTLRRRGA